MYIFKQKTTDKNIYLRMHIFIYMHRFIYIKNVILFPSIMLKTKITFLSALDNHLSL